VNRRVTEDFVTLAGLHQRFDVCVVIGVGWDPCLGVRTHRPHGDYNNAYGAVWREDRVDLGSRLSLGTWDRTEGCRSDPLLVSFKRRSFEFTMVLLHTRWTNDEDSPRANEVKTLGELIPWHRSSPREKDLVLGGRREPASGRGQAHFSGTRDAAAADEAGVGDGAVGAQNGQQERSAWPGGSKPVME
jgi:hypothetical protein